MWILLDMLWKGWGLVRSRQRSGKYHHFWNRSAIDHIHSQETTSVLLFVCLICHVSRARNRVRNQEAQESNMEVSNKMVDCESNTGWMFFKLYPNGICVLVDKESQKLATETTTLAKFAWPEMLVQVGRSKGLTRMMMGYTCFHQQVVRLYWKEFFSLVFNWNTWRRRAHNCNSVTSTSWVTLALIIFSSKLSLL